MHHSSARNHAAEETARREPGTRGSDPAPASDPKRVRSSVFGLPSRGSFTLVELLGVLVVVAILVGIVLRSANYVQVRAGVARAKADLAAMAIALDNYKTDYGYYPISSNYKLNVGTAIDPRRSVFSDFVNSTYLYRALSGVAGGKVYLIFHRSQLTQTTSWMTTNPCTATTGTLPAANAFAILDPFGSPYNYFNLNNASCLTNQKLQINKLAYDIFSAGPDRTPNTADDVANYGR